MKSSSRPLALAAVLLLGGCVLRTTYYQKVEETAEAYRELEGTQKKVDQASERLKALQEQYDEAKKQVEAYEKGTLMDVGGAPADDSALKKAQADLGAARAEADRLRGDVARAQAEADRLRGEAEELRRRPPPREVVRVEAPPPPDARLNGTADLGPIQKELSALRKAQEEGAAETEALKELVEEALRRPAPAVTTVPVERIIETRTVETHTLQVPTAGVTVEERPARLEISLAGDVSFESGRCALTPAAQAALQSLKGRLSALRDRLVWVVGHTDSVEIRSTYRARIPTNWELSMARAIVVARFLESDLGVEPGRIYPTGLGKNHPLASNATEEGRARNRRVEILLVPRDPSLFP